MRSDGKNRDIALLSPERIEQRILLMRGHRVMLDTDLAELYGVPTKALNQAIKRNRERFPEDFVFQLNREEAKSLARLRSQNATSNRSQIVTGSQRHRDPRFLPYAFTEHGAIMAANVLNSPRAVEASVFVVRAFVRLRRFLASHAELALKLSELERRIGGHDRTIRDLVVAIRGLMAPPPESAKEPIGFHPRKGLPEGGRTASRLRRRTFVVRS